MTVTVKLPIQLEQSLRERSAALGMSASALIRDALQQYLDTTVPQSRSPFALGQDLFGKHGGPSSLAASRKKHVVDVWVDKQARRRVPPRG
jgi:Arc/MetJ-type ribon-helix-helix transcriptional regulator